MRLSLISFIFVITANCAEASIARVVTLRGSVDLIRNGKTISALHVGDTVETGDVLKTGDSSALKLLFSDRTIVDLGSKSEFKVNQFLLNKTSDRKVDLELVNGKMRTSVNEKVTGSGDFKVKSKSIVMGVRGTEFVVESVEATGPVSEGLGQTQITVLEGSVAVQSQVESPGAGSIGSAVAVGSSGATVSTQAVSLSAGQQMNSAALAPSANGAPAPVVQNLSSDQTAKVSQTATVSDRSFQMAVNLEPLKESRSEAKSESRSESKAENKSGQKSSGPDAGSQKGPSTQSPAGPPPPPALAAVIQNVTTIAAAAPPPMIDMGSMKTPGAANDTQSLPPPNLSPINMTIGQPVKVNVSFSP